jgi:hypothetical protein
MGKYEGTFTQLLPALPAKPRTTFVVQVQENQTEEFTECMWGGCDGIAEYADDGDGDVEAVSEEVYQCSCCAGWYCEKHFEFGSTTCKECMKLPFHTIQAIIAFREKLNKDELE